MATGVIRSSRVSPAFLHGNSTSHTWAFSAIAELIDNAYDPDVNAAELRIDTRVINGTVCLTFVDNGNGMTQDKLHKMLSFGYCEKKQIGKIKPIGYYGNGFKSGSMRLGKDAIVFTRNKDSMSVGLLSQTFLKSINAESVLVPIVTWDLPSRKCRVDQDTTSNLNAILQHSIFHREAELLNELSGLDKVGHGTSIIIYNLKMTSEKLELDFNSDPFDIRNPETHIIDLTSINRPIIQYQPEYRRSLREYCSILYLKPRMKIVIRGKKVKTKLMSKSLSQTEMDVYKPTWLDKPIHITFGFTSSKNPEDYGMMMYHKNRLIKAFEKVGYQKQATALGVGVIGVVEANFLEPIHNKQDFSRTERYSAFITNVSTKLNDYWNEKTSGGSAQNRTETQVKLPDWTWAQCDNCLKWRRLPTGLNAGGLPDKWYCRMNPDASFNRCDVEEEPEDDDEALQQPTYKKTFKKKLEEKKRAEEYEKMRKIQAKEQELKQREEALKRKSIQLSEEVSSSQDSELGQRRPTVGDLDNAKKRLDVYKERLIEQQKIIMNLERQKKVIEEQSHDMLQMAEQLKLSNINTNNLIENVNLLAGTSSATVSSSSSVKRKNSGKGRPTKMFIKTEDGDTVTVIQNEVDEDDNVIDLTSDQEKEQEDVEEEKQAANPNTSQKDVKPNVEGLEKAIKDSKPAVELAHKTVQTVPVMIRLATRDEIDLEKLSPLEKRQHLVAKYREVCELQKKLDDTNTRFKSLQGNICNLLKIIVPDFDYGQPDDIENVILDFIRVNAETDSKS